MDPLAVYGRAKAYSARPFGVRTRHMRTLGRAGRCALIGLQAGPGQHCSRMHAGNRVRDGGSRRTGCGCDTAGGGRGDSPGLPRLPSALEAGPRGRRAAVRRGGRLGRRPPCGHAGTSSGPRPAPARRQRMQRDAVRSVGCRGTHGPARRPRHGTAGRQLPTFARRDAASVLLDMAKTCTRVATPEVASRADVAAALQPWLARVRRRAVCRRLLAGVR